ncbi:MAG TPA: helix-turn-helix domain-containing protein [Gemmata sp.]
MAKSKPVAAANGKAALPLSPLDVLTLAEAAAYLRLPEDAVREEAEAGRLVGRHVRGEWRFARSAVVEWLSAPPSTARPQTGAELVEHIRRTNTGLAYEENPEAAEAEIAELNKLRKTMWG